jgi:dienelactone hydrolase
MVAQPLVKVTPQPALLDQPPAIEISGLEAGADVTVRAAQRDALGRHWESSACYVADADGVLDLGNAPHAGSYRSADPAGLFWSMALLPDQGEPTPFAFPGLGPLLTTLTVEIGGDPVAETTIERRLLAPGIRQHTLAEGELRGEFFVPPGDGPFPTVLCVSGSGGGIRGAIETASLLASHGYATLALAYFNYEDRPPYLIEIPLEYFQTSLGWLAARPEVDGARLGGLGRSRGGELALLLGATFPELRSIVAYVPSGVVHGGIGEDSAGRSAWTWRGEPVPFLRDQVTPEQDAAIFGDEPITLTPRFELNLEDCQAVADAMIPVERINGPVLLLSGEADKLWPSTRLANIAEERLAEFNHPYPVRHLRYANVGHSISLPGLPTTVTTIRHPIRKQVFELGGEPQAQSAANRDSWQHVLTFLAEGLSATARATD